MKREELCKMCLEGICDVHSPSQMMVAQKEYARLQVVENRRAKQRKGRNGNANAAKVAGGELRRPPAHLRC